MAPCRPIHRKGMRFNSRRLRNLICKSRFNCVGVPGIPTLTLGSMQKSCLHSQILGVFIHSGKSCILDAPALRLHKHGRMCSCPRMLITLLFPTMFMHREQICQDALRGHHATLPNTLAAIWLRFVPDKRLHVSSQLVMFVHLHAELLGRSFRHSNEAFGDEVVVKPCLGVDGDAAPPIWHPCWNGRPHSTLRQLRHMIIHAFKETAS